MFKSLTAAALVASVSAFGSGDTGCVDAVSSYWETMYNGQPGVLDRLKVHGLPHTIHWMTFPDATTATDMESMAAISAGWDQVADWKCTAHGHKVFGDLAMYECNWNGSTSKINGAVMDASAPSTVHIVDCAAGVEKVYADYGNVLKFMGAA